ncbi:uncharacterized protein LOC100844282 [Brachypodium distachyon]|uniref:Uncharacterized protein n=1 Tax=Brachypodium distachyon TaxID=15368 RepID=A0A0Q3Q485_BRADI|nr:uncharacterized protein LOC100844282 [Brachypodium distachyon]KQJ96457.1 hypothetical protein BRADI_3g23210v3 [Brachypodium distachyon]|eukprot:XP_010234682.2 uncharacterized protein LOC100844282 [Brachypodium distachyon]
MVDQQDRSGDSSVIEMASLAQELTGKLETLKSSQAQLGDDRVPRGSTRIIVAKVPDSVRGADKVEYEHDYVSIGPYNCPRPQSNNLHLPREQDKLSSLDDVLTAAMAVRPSITVEVYVEELARLEPFARSCYGPVDYLTSQEFVRMLLLDGCYILSCFTGIAAPAARNDEPAATENGGVPGPAADSTVARGGVGMLDDLSLVRDVFYLAENQIPFAVLEKIAELTCVDGNKAAATVEGIVEYALKLLKAYAVQEAPAPAPTAAPGNLLHLLHMHLKPTVLSPPAAMEVASVGRWRTATEYVSAGVTFKKRNMGVHNEDARCILDVKLSGSTLEIPCLDIDGKTWRFLRNLIQLEQQNRETVGTHVTAYCVFMSQVACTEKDVELLSKAKAGVIGHGQGTDAEVAACFADLCKGIMFDPDDSDGNYLEEIWQVLEKRVKSNPRRWMAWLWREHFRNPCLALGLLAAAVALVCGVVQAVYSVLTYRQGFDLH